MCLARAYYDSDRLPEAKGADAMALDETDAIAAFDAADGRRRATKTFARHDKTAAECRAGMDELQEAAAAFGRLVEGLRKGRVSKESGLDAKKVEEHQRYCIEFTERARVHLQHAEESEKAARIKAEKEARAIEAELARIEAERVQKETAERERVEALERRAREHKDNFREMQAKWKDSEAEPEAKPRRAKKDADVDMAEAGNGLPDEEGDLADAGLLDSDDDDGGDGGEPGARARRAGAGMPIGRRLGGGTGQRQRRRQRRRRGRAATKSAASEVEEAAGEDDVPAGLGQRRRGRGPRRGRRGGRGAAPASGAHGRPGTTTTTDGRGRARARARVRGNVCTHVSRPGGPTDSQGVATAARGAPAPRPGGWRSGGGGVPGASGAAARACLLSSRHVLDGGGGGGAQRGLDLLGGRLQAGATRVRRGPPSCTAPRRPRRAPRSLGWW